MKSFLAFVGCLAILYVFVAEFIMDSDPIPTTPLTPEQVVTAKNAAILKEYREEYKGEMDRKKKTLYLVHKDASDVVYIGEGWVVYRLLGSCFMAKRQSWSSQLGFTNTEVGDNVCTNAVELPEFPPELTLTPTPTVGEVQY